MVNEAYSVLSDPKTREEYDKSLERVSTITLDGFGEKDTEEPGGLFDKLSDEEIADIFAPLFEP